jgi:Zn-finger nucleic acid-binding protein
MQRLPTLGGELDHCPGCRGHWVCGPALSQAASPVAEWARRPRPPNVCLQGLHVLPAGQEACSHCPRPRLDCPTCEGRLAPVGVAGVVVDLCLRCPGVWLDAGELASLKRAREARPLRSELPIFLPVSEQQATSTVEKVGDALEATCDAFELLELGVDAARLVGNAVGFVLRVLVE